MPEWTVEAVTRFPKPPTGSTQVRGDPPQRWSLLGSSETKAEYKLILRLAAGLELSAARGLAEGTVLIQVGAPTDAPNVEGVFFTISPFGKGPLITKVEGAVSAVVRAAINLWTAKLQKEWQWDALRFVIDRSSEPSFELVPMRITYTVINAASVPQQNFVGVSTNIVERFYPAGSLDLTEQSRPLLIFTGIDPATGQMTVMVSLRAGQGDQWARPVKLASASGVVSVATALNPSGGWIAVWSEIAETDVGNPYPSSTIKYSVSNADGTTWSNPASVASSTEAMFDLKLVRAGDRVLLLYLSTREGPLADNRGLHSSAWDGKAWAAPIQLLPPQPIQGFDVAGHAGGAGLVVVSNESGELRSISWNGNAWSAPKRISDRAEDALSVRFDSANRAVLAWEHADGSLAFSRFDTSTENWTNATFPVRDAFATDCETLPLAKDGETLYLLAWTEGGDKTSLWYAFVDSLGATRFPATEATVDSAGRFKSLHVRPLDGFRAAIVAQYSAGTNVTVREFVVGLPSAGDCDSNGISDADEIASGLAQDCNRNGIPDHCEIANLKTADRNHNGIPDECEPPPPGDCNRNGIADRYEISLGIGDANKNGVLDECEAGARTKVIPLPKDVPTRYYRATGIIIKSRSADSLELQYEGNLEQADSVAGPWRIVP